MSHLDHLTSNLSGPFFIPVYLPIAIAFSSGLSKAFTHCRFAVWLVYFRFLLFVLHTYV
jgi:hypothetical protein